MAPIDLAGDDTLLATAAEEVLAQDWMAGVQASVARRLGMAESTISRRFGGTDGFRKALVSWIMASQERREVVDARSPHSPGDRLRRAAQQVWDDVATDPQRLARMVLWSRAGSDHHQRARMRAHFEYREQRLRNLWQDTLTGLRRATDDRVLQRPGMTEAEFALVVNALAEGLWARSLPGDVDRLSDLYEIAFIALASAAIDVDGDLLSIDEKVTDQFDNSTKVKPSSKGSAP